MNTAKKFSDIEKTVKKSGYRGIWDCTVRLHGFVVVYKFRKNLLGKSTLKPFDAQDIEGFIALDTIPFHKAVGIRPEKENWFHEKIWLGEKSFPVNFTIHPLST